MLGVTRWLHDSLAWRELFGEAVLQQKICGVDFIVLISCVVCWSAAGDRFTCYASRSCGRSCLQAWLENELLEGFLGTQNIFGPAGEKAGVMRDDLLEILSAVRD